MSVGSQAVIEQLEELQMAASKTALYHVEVIAGVAREKPLPKYLHQVIQQRILALLSAGRPPETVLSQLDFVCNGDLRVPDIVVFAPGARFENGMLADPPLLCVEILSPGQTLSDLFAKCEAYHGAGVRLCWVISPRKMCAWIYTSDGILQTDPGALAFGDTVVRLDELFANLPAEAN